MKNETNTYRKIDNGELVSFVNEQLYIHEIESDFDLRHATGTTRIMEWTLTGDEYKTIFQGDIVYPKITIINSYNKETALSMGVGVYRLVCANGLKIGDLWADTKFKHRAGQSFETKLVEMQTDLVDLILWLAKGTYLDDYAQMVSKPLTTEQAYEIAGNLRVPVKTKDVLFGLIAEPARERDIVTDIWTLYNVANEALSITVPNDKANIKHNDTLLEDVVELAKVV